MISLTQKSTRGSPTAFQAWRSGCSWLMTSQWMVARSALCRRCGGRRCRRHSARNHLSAHAREIVEYGGRIHRQHRSRGGRGRSRDQQIVRTSRPALAPDLRHKTSMDPGDVRRVLLDRDQRENFIHKSLPIGPSCRIGQLHTDEQLGHSDRRDRHIIGVSYHRVHGCLTSLGGNEHTGVKDQASGHVPLISSSIASRAAATSASKSASNVPTLLARNALTIRPGAVGAGPITAIRFPPRVTTIVSPRSASSRTVAKLRDASVAVITFIKSDYLIPEDRAGRTR